MERSGRSTTILSTNGHIILPKAIRDQRGWTAGTTFTVEETADGVVLRTAPAFPPTRLEDVFGCLPAPATAKTIGDMDTAVADDVRRRHAGD